MPDKPSPQPKPVTEVWKPELVRLPKLTPWRRAFRRFSHGLVKSVAWSCLRVTTEGMENIPPSGPFLIAINHIGDADAPALVSVLPFTPDALGKIELYDLPILGRLMDWYGIIWLHRGKPDKRALRAALDGLAEGRAIVIAPVLPIAITGTENENVYGCMKRLRRAPVHIRVGKAFKLESRASARHKALIDGTRRIMAALGDLLPEKYRGE